MYIPLYSELLFLFPSKRMVGNVRPSQECAIALISREGEDPNRSKTGGRRRGKESTATTMLSSPLDFRHITRKEEGVEEGW